MEDTAEAGEKEPSVNTTGTDGRRSCPGGGGEQRGVTPSIQQPRGSFGAPSGSGSGGVGLTPAVLRPEMSPATRHWPGLEPVEPRWSGQPRPGGSADALQGEQPYGDPDSKPRFHKKHPVKAGRKF